MTREARAAGILRRQRCLVLGTTDADGIQLAATARIVGAAEVDQVLARQLSPQPPYDLATPGEHLIELAVTELYVFDHTAWTRSRLDGRLAVDVTAVFALL